MIYLESDTVFKWDGMLNSLTGLPVTDAAITGKILNLDESEVLTFLFVPDETAGDYVGTITATQSEALEEGGEYIVEIVATSGLKKETRRERHTADYRSF